MVSVSISAVRSHVSFSDIPADMPDLTDAINVAQLVRWEGSWAYLSTIKWVRITSAGHVQSSSFPPKGDN